MSQCHASEGVGVERSRCGAGLVSIGRGAKPAAVSSGYGMPPDPLALELRLAPGRVLVFSSEKARWNHSQYS